ARHPQPGELLGEHLSLAHPAAVGEVPAEDEQVRLLVDLLDELPEAPVVVLAAVEVTHRRHSNPGVPVPCPCCVHRSPRAGPRPTCVRPCTPTRGCPRRSSPGR